ncbi:MAG: DMT family transporter [Gemmatimonadetes bacterium]|nr:DMT family transporter [Gemmatimonadota bacterium]
MLSTDGEQTTALGLLLLITATVVTSCFGLILKSAHHNGHNALAVGSLNYGAGAVISGLLMLADPGWAWHWTTVWIGAVSGFFYFVAFRFLIQALLQGGVAVTLAIVRLSVLIPILCSIVIWYEVPNLAQIAGIITVCIALPLLTLGVGRQAELSLRGVAWLVGALFITTGFCHLSPKVFSELAPQSQMPLYLFSLFAVSGIMGFFYFWTKPIRARMPELRWSVLLGAVNVSGTWLLVLTLKYLPGTVVFPFVSAVGLVITTLVAILYWKEQVRGLAYVGIGLTLVAVVLVNSG